MGAPFILAVNFAIAAALACGFCAIYLYDRSRKPAFWWTAYMLALMLIAAVHAVALVITAPAATRFVSFVLNMAAIGCLNLGIARHYDKPVPWRLMAAAGIGGVVVTLVAVLLRPETAYEWVSSSFALAIAQFIGLWVLRQPGRGRRDTVFAVMLGLLCLNYFSRPFLEGAWGERTVEGGMSLALAITEMNTTFLTIGLATVLTLRLAGRMVRDFKGQSETDSLSGLLNRHGFDLAVQRLRTQNQSSVPTALIVCDLDRFKAVNDRYGHFAGDRVIAAFGRQLREGLRDGDVCGRFGGEEFCIYMRNCDLQSARLFAEWLRGAFSSTRYPDFAANTRFTASFGVTEVVPGERIEDAYRRADRALYEAKYSGRDCVRLCDRNGAGLGVAGNGSVDPARRSPVRPAP